MKRKNRIISSFLTVLLIINALPLKSSAAQEGALPKNTPKEEVVYINLNTDGSVKEINIVNIFDLNEKGKIIDYGKYENLRNMTTTDIINYQNDVVTIDAGAGKLYYEGRLKENIMPWTVSIKYFMDSKEYSADKIAGMSGKFKMKMSIKQNEKCDSPFFEGYALQATFTLNTEKAANIRAEGATIANVGSDKQLVYTILPNKGAEIEIAADVTDFEMESVSINGIPLNLNIEIDDDELMERIADLQGAVGKLDDGTGKVYDGVAKLRDGVQSDLKSGASDLKDGASKLQDGVSQLKDGGGSLQSGAADLQSGASSLDEGIKSLNDGIIQMQNALDSLNAQSGSLRGGSSDFKAALEKLQSSLDGMSISSEKLSELTAASSSIKGGIDNVVNGIGGLQQSVNFDAYKAAMGEKGIYIDDIDVLKQNNSKAASSLEPLISSLQGKVEGLQQAGESTSELEQQIEQLESVKTLLEKNNEAIAGTMAVAEGYLNTVSDKISDFKAKAGELQTGYAAFDAEIIKLADALGNLAYQMSSLTSAINSLVSAYQKIDGGIADYTNGVAQIAAGYSKISDGAAKLVTGSGSLVSGTQNLYNGTGELLSGIEEVYNGTGTLTDGTEELDDGVSELLDGIVKLYNGTGELKDGTSAFKKETTEMDTEVRGKIDELIDGITGGDMETVSFASKQNIAIKSVQFVIKTEGIEKAEPVYFEIEERKPLTFWQKLLRLFGLDSIWQKSAVKGLFEGDAKSC